MTPLGSRARLAAATAAIALLGLAFGSLAAGGIRGSEPRLDEVRLSVLAVGDTGWRTGLPSLLDPQMRVAQALREADRRQPTAAFLLLGDNFYYEGLRSSELVPRIRQNLVEPYCWLLALSGPRAPEVADSCRVAPGERHPVPIYAVLGNHDYNSAESPELERHMIPRFIANWHMPDRVAESVELGSGVSLVLIEYLELLRAEDSAALVDALRGSTGPWRILAIHQPISTQKLAPGVERMDPAQTTYARLLSEAIEAAGVPVHLVISGDEHNLQMLVMPPPHPPLHVVAGGGSRPRQVESWSPYRRFEHVGLGFARLDLVGGSEPRLVASLYAVASVALAPLHGSRLVARWSVDAGMRTRDELAPAS